jgi:hypothetical protein
MRLAKWLRFLVVRAHPCSVMETNFTTQAVAATSGADPEFVDLPGLKNRFGIGRSLAYLLIEKGDIRSVCLRRKGCIKGKRLIDVQSARAWIEKQLAEQEVETVDPALSAICKKANRVMREKKAEREAAEKAKQKAA